jgi:hypothetical protein
MFGLLLSVVTKVCGIHLEPPSVPRWTEEELESFVTLWLIIFSAWIKTAIVLLYHSEGCNICELVLHECYINDLYTTTCSGMLGHHNICGLWPLRNTILHIPNSCVQKYYCSLQHSFIYLFVLLAGSLYSRTFWLVIAFLFWERCVIALNAYLELYSKLKKKSI